LRTPLRAINGFAHILAEDKADLLDEEARQLLNKICTSSEKMGSLIDSILSLSRITRQELDIHRVNISSLCHAIIDDLADSYDLESVAINVQDNIKVEGDKKLLRIVFDNLIRNALKFSAGTDRPVITIAEQPGEEGRSVIFVQDNGAGFDMSYVDRLFKPFQRLHDESEYRGYGVGLAIVYRIIERHGGKIWATSEPGAGTTIYIELGKKA
jgi:signal transduction histidine kinase